MLKKEGFIEWFPGAFILIFLVLFILKNPSVVKVLFHSKFDTKDKKYIIKACIL